MDKEEWRSVKGYEGAYKVSNRGRIISMPRILIDKNGKNYKVNSKLMIPRVHPKGYMRIGLQKEKKRKERTVHSLVAEVFLDHTLRGMNSVVNHKDKDRTNNYVDNLEIITNKENLKDKRNNGILNGVFKIKDRNEWSAIIHTDKKYKRLGIHKSERDAQQEYNNVIGSVTTI